MLDIVKILHFTYFTFIRAAGHCALSSAAIVGRFSIHDVCLCGSRGPCPVPRALSAALLVVTRLKYYIANVNISYMPSVVCRLLTTIHILICVFENKTNYNFNRVIRNVLDLRQCMCVFRLFILFLRRFLNNYSQHTLFSFSPSLSAQSHPFVFTRWTVQTPPTQPCFFLFYLLGDFLHETDMFSCF